MFTFLNVKKGLINGIDKLLRYLSKKDLLNIRNTISFDKLRMSGYKK